MSSLKRAFRRLMTEADLNWKWDKQGQSLGPRQDRRDPNDQQPAKSHPQGQGTTSADLEPKPDEPEAEPAAGKSARHVVPLPTEGDAGAKNIGFGKNFGFKKLGTFLVNPKHWEKGTAGDAGSLNWEGSSWIKPKSPEAKEFTRIVKVDKLRPADAWKPDVWKKHFEHKFGPIDESVLREFFERFVR